MIYTSQKVKKLNAKRPQLWRRSYLIDGDDYTVVLMPDNTMYRFGDKYFPRVWYKIRAKQENREDLEQYGDFIGYI